jgi:c-di-GMP-binding flagellar brake protein YcgR
MNKVNQDFTDDIKSYITIHELLQVRILDDPNPTTYYGRISDIADGKLVIAWPTNAGVRLAVHRDQLLDFSFIRDGEPCAFTGLVDEVSLDPMPQITIIMSSAVMHVQRRQNFRVKCLIPVEIRGSSRENSQEDASSLLCIRTTTYDLSASGFSIRHPKSIPEGSIVEIKLGLPDNGPNIKAPCRIIYSEEFGETLKLYRTGLTYLALSEAERARIVRFVYRTQLKGLSP